MQREIKKIGIIGSGIMGSGIAQISAQSGHQTYLYDVQNGASEKSKLNLISTFEKLQAKNKLSVEQVNLAINNIYIASELADLVECDLIIEAIVENLAIKQKLLKDLETLVSDDTILASNTSSLSITSIAAQCKFPERVIGFHFFNPVPLMKVVEVIAGLKTEPVIIQKLSQLAQAFGHRAVITKDTPGFIINHAGRAYGTEALKILNENIADISDIDRVLRDGVGFRMGPFELLDLTGLDVSHPVMESIYHQYYEEPRYKPNPLTQQMLEAKLLGRKTQAGFYQYADGHKYGEKPCQTAVKPESYPSIWIAADFIEDKKILEHYISNQNIRLDISEKPNPKSLCIIASYGEDTTHSSLRFKTDPHQTVCIDMLYGFDKHRTLMPSLITHSELIETAHYIFSRDNTHASVIQESIGFIAQRILSMVINLGCDIAQQQIATVDDINAAVRLGLGYPFGPIEWGDQLGADKILLILNRISALTNDPRYRPSPWLQRRVALNLPLTFAQS